MAKLTGVIRFNGKVGEVVAAKDSQGKEYIRKYVDDPKNPNTLPQIKARTQFLTNTALASVCKEGAIGLAPRAKQTKLSLTNVLQQVNKNAITTTATESGASSTIDYTKIKFSQGSVEAVAIRQPATSETNPLVIECAFNDDLAAANRNVFLVAYNPNLNKVVISDPNPSTGNKASIAVPQSWAGMEVHIYSYTQEFETEGQAVDYISYWSSARASGNAVLAYATIRTMSEAAKYSPTLYRGTIEVGS